MTSTLLMPDRARHTVHYSSKTVEWATPRRLFRELNHRFGFELDVCATAENATCQRFFTKSDDGLAQEWTGVCWMNPPYGRQIGKWVTKARRSAERGATVVCLLPARTDTQWWHRHVEPVLRGRIPGEVTFIEGRLKFGGASQGAPFPSVIVVFAPAEGA